ncbi:MAG: hypothetical protein ACXWRE_12700 [Pseudobdellovibrionaceae bacterium]
MFNKTTLALMSIVLLIGSTPKAAEQTGQPRNAMVSMDQPILFWCTDQSGNLANMKSLHDVIGVTIKADAVILSMADGKTVSVPLPKGKATCTAEPNYEGSLAD